MKSIFALAVSAAAGLLLGIAFYFARESFGYQYRWGSESHELRVLYALQLGLVGGAALYVFLLRKIRTRSRSLYPLFILLVLALLTTYFLHSATWVVVISLCIIAVVGLMAAMPGKNPP